MKTASFTNFTTESFTGYWDGKAKTFAPGAQVYMPDYLARHFAKHLVNRELLRTDSDGNLVYKDGDKMTSPKKPEDIPLYQALFNKAFQLDELEELGNKKDDIDTLINVANKNREKRLQHQSPSVSSVLDTPLTNTPVSTATDTPVTQDTLLEIEADPTKPQIIIPPDFDKEDE